MFSEAQWNWVTKKVQEHELALFRRPGCDNYQHIMHLLLRKCTVFHVRPLGASCDLSYGRQCKEIPQRTVRICVSGLRQIGIFIKLTR